MEKLWKISKIVLLIFVCFSLQLELHSQEKSENHIYFKLPYQKTAFQVCGIFHADSILVYKKTIKKSNFYYLNFQRFQCEQFYIVSLKDSDRIEFLVRKSISTRTPSTNVIRLVFEESAMEYLIMHKELMPKLEITDTILRNLLHDNRLYYGNNLETIYHYLYNSLIDNSFADFENEVAYNLVFVNKFLLLQMTEFELNCMLGPCTCTYKESCVEIPYRPFYERKLTLVAIPISNIVYQKYKDSIRNYLIDNPLCR